MLAVTFFLGRGCAPGPAAQTVADVGGVASTVTVTTSVTLPASTVEVTLPPVTVTATKPAKSKKATAAKATSQRAVVDVGGGSDPQFSACRAAKAAGYGPYYSGTDPEYDWYRDADGDGVVCE